VCPIGAWSSPAPAGRVPLVFERPVAQEPDGHAVRRPPVAPAAPAAGLTAPHSAAASGRPAAAADAADALGASLARAVDQRAGTRHAGHAVLARGKQLKPAAKAPAPAAHTPHAFVSEAFNAGGHAGVRTTKVTAPLVATKVPARAKTPVALAFTGAAPPLGFDGGHVIGLHLGGDNVSSNVVPMYPRFNRGVWKSMEDDLKGRAAGAQLTMAVTMTYGGPDPRFPSSFLVEVGNAATGAVIRKTLRQPEDIPLVAALSDADKLLLNAAESFTKPLPDQPDMFQLDGKTFAQAVAATGGRHLPKSRKAMYPDKPADRPYGNLDILALNGVLGHLGLGGMGAFTDFSAAQRELLLQVNSAVNGGTMKSDDPDDPCQILDPRGAANAPEIDHIIPKVLGGSNFFSNARVVSWQLNNKEDRIKPISELLDVSRLAAPTLPTKLADKAAVIAAQWLAHHPDEDEVAPSVLSTWIVLRWPTLGPEKLSPRLVKAVFVGLAAQGVREGVSRRPKAAIKKPRHMKNKRDHERKKHGGKKRSRYATK
jgi:hypothetical protein